MHTIDTHSHFNLSQFEGDVSEAIGRMEDAGVGTICIGIDIDSSKRAVELARENKSIWACIGQHPTEWRNKWDPIEMEKLSRGDRVVAIGECGLDYYREKDREGVNQQKEIFLSHINLAKEHNFPLMLHIRPREGAMDAYEDALDILEEEKYDGMRGTAHFFAGNRDIAKRFLDLGFHISFSGVITFVPEYEELVSYVPTERILPETDAPFAAPAPYRGRRNEPAYVLEVVKKIAQIKGVPEDEMREMLLKNAKELFSIE